MPQKVKDRPYDSDDLRELMYDVGGWAQGWDDVLWYLETVAPHDPELFQREHVQALISDVKHLSRTGARLEQIEEVSTVFDEIPGRVRFPDPFGELEYMHKHVEYFHHHFAKVAEAALRLFRREPFEHLIIGGLWESLPQFESHLHRYLRDRIAARWEIEVHTPTPHILERALQEEQRFLKRQAKEIWTAIQAQRLQRGALGPEEVFAALWQRRVQELLVEPGVVQPGFRCSACGRLQLRRGPCVECSGKLEEVSDVHEEAIHLAVEQSALVRRWKDPVLNEVGSVAALKRF